MFTDFKCKKKKMCIIISAEMLTTLCVLCFKSNVCKRTFQEISFNYNLAIITFYTTGNTSNI